MRHWHLVVGVQFALLSSQLLAQAGDIGIATPIGWQGTSARHIIFNPLLTVFAEDVHLGVPDSESHLIVEDGENAVWGAIDTSPWEIHGYFDVGAELPAEELQELGGFFRDEIYVATASGNPVVLDFDLGLQVSMDNLDTDFGDSVARLTLSMAYYPEAADSIANGSFKLLDNFAVEMVAVEHPGEDGGPTWYSYQAVQEDWDEGQQEFTTLDEGYNSYYFSDVVSFSSDGRDAGLQVASGTWLPVTIVLWGTACNSSVNWSDTLSLDEVLVYDAATGALLGPSEYTLVSENNRFPSNGVIPEPATLWLMFSSLSLWTVFGRCGKARVTN